MGRLRSRRRRQAVSEAASDPQWARGGWEVIPSTIATATAG